MSQRPKDIFQLYIYNTATSAWVEYSDGIIDVDIKRGAQEYKGPFTQSDVGQMIVRTRSMEVDPYQNPLVRYNNQIRITATAEGNTPNNFIRAVIFTGFIEGINVEYRPKTEDSIVTITAIDIIGQLYKHVLSQEFIGLQESWTMSELLSAMDTQEEFEWLNGVPFTVADRPAYAVGAINSNTTAWDALTIRAKTDLGFLFSRRGTNHIGYISSDKDSPSNPYNNSVYNISNLNVNNGVFTTQPFKSDGTGQSYKSIQISDGFERVVNDLTVKGFQADIRSTNDNSVAVWRKTQANVNVSTNDIEDMQAIANEVLQEMSEPIREIFSITFDGTKYPTSGLVADMFSSVNIVHDINESLSIDRKYAIIGVNHKIDYNNWEVTFQLRNIAYQDSSIDNPIISVSPSSGTTATDFNFAYTISNPELIVSQEWDLDEGFTSTSETASANYATGGTKTITLTVTTIYGYTITSSVQLEVAGAIPSGTIDYSVDANGVYTFSFVGETATSYYWQFGNGKVSSSPNPTTYYNTTTSVTVSLSVTNIYGTSVITRNISVNQSTAMPVRFIKFKLKGSTEALEDMLSYGEDRFAATSTNYLSIKKIDILRQNSTRITNVSLINYKEYTNYVTSSKHSRVNYGRSPREVESGMKENWFGTNNIPLWIPSYKFATPTYSAEGGHVGLEFTIDLLDEFLDIGTIGITGTSNVTNKRYDIEVSEDGETWKRAGFISRSIAEGGTFYQINVAANMTGSLPVPRTALSATPEMTDVRKIRYMKFEFNAPVGPQINGYSPHWVIKELFPITGAYNWYQKGTNDPTPAYYPPKNVFTYMGPSLIDSNTGAYLELAQAGTTGGILPMDGAVIPTGASTNSIRIFAPAALTRLNDQDTNKGYCWPTGTTGNGIRTMVYDFGEVKTNISGFAFQGIGFLRTDLTWTIKAYTSEDGITWDELGVYSMLPENGSIYNYTAARVVRSSNNRPIKTTDNATTMVNELVNINQFN